MVNKIEPCVLARIIQNHNKMTMTKNSAAELIRLRLQSASPTTDSSLVALIVADYQVSSEDSGAGLGHNS